jgi:hypothetical protein
VATIYHTHYINKALLFARNNCSGSSTENALNILDGDVKKVTSIL